MIVFIFDRYAIGTGTALLAVLAIGGLDVLKTNIHLAVDTPNAYTRRVKQSGTITHC